MTGNVQLIVFFFFKIFVWGYVYWFWRERKAEREKNIDVRNIDQLPPIHAQTRDWTSNLGAYPGWELNLLLFGVQDYALTIFPPHVHPLVPVTGTDHVFSWATVLVSKPHSSLFPFFLPPAVPGKQGGWYLCQPRGEQEEKKWKGGGDKKCLWIRSSAPWTPLGAINKGHPPYAFAPRSGVFAKGEQSILKKLHKEWYCGYTWLSTTLNPLHRCARTLDAKENSISGLSHSFTRQFGDHCSGKGLINSWEYTWIRYLWGPHDLGEVAFSIPQRALWGGFHYPYLTPSKTTQRR